MEINFKQLLSMLHFLWSNGPPRLKYALLPLALVAGFSRDYVMIVVNQWPDRCFVPGDMRDYCMFDASSRGVGLVAMVIGAGGL